MIHPIHVAQINGSPLCAYLGHLNNTAVQKSQNQFDIGIWTLFEYHVGITGGRHRRQYPLQVNTGRTQNDAMSTQCSSIVTGQRHITPFLLL